MQVTGIGNGQVQVSGELDIAGTSVPLAFDASVRLIGAELELEATTIVNQASFGMGRARSTTSGRRRSCT